MDLRSWLSALGGAPAGGAAYGMAAPPVQSAQPMGLAVPPMARGTKLSAEMDYDGTHPRQQEQAARDHFRSYGPQTLADAFIPGYGAGGDAKAASEAYGEGRYGAAALNAGMAALDFVPVLGALPAAVRAARFADGAVDVVDRGGGLFKVTVDGADAGDISLSRSGKFVSSASLYPDFQGKRIGPVAYDKIEALTGSKISPSPLGLSANARPFWRRRLAEMEPAQRAELIRQSYEEGIRLGVPDKDVRMRLYEIGGSEALDALELPAAAKGIRAASNVPSPRGYDDVADWLHSYLGSRTGKSEEDLRAQVRRVIQRANEPPHFGDFRPIDEAVADQVPIVTKGKSFVLSQRGRGPAKPKINASPEPIGRAPGALWGGLDNQDYRKTAKPGEVVEDLYVDLETIPKEGLAGGVTGYDWSELERATEIPPVTLRQNKNGSLSIIDGNHRLRWARERGFDSVPAYVIRPKDNTGAQ